MTKKRMKRCSTSLITSEMQIKTTVRRHRTLIRTPIKKKEIGTLVHRWWTYRMVEPL